MYYFTDQSEIRVFSRTQGAWLAPFSIKGATRLYGLALSPDGSKLAVGDAGNDVIDVLDPDTPTAVSTFTLPNTAFDASTLPSGVAITDAGTVYYATFQSNLGTGAYSLHKLNTSTGSVTDYQEFNYGGGTDDPYNRILLSSDNCRLYFNLDGVFGAIDTATDTVYENPPFTGGDNELTLSSNQTWMSAEGYLMDTNLNIESGLALTERETWNQEAVYGEKMSADGNLLFLPLSNAIDVFDGRRGSLLKSIALPVTLSPNYDALVSDGIDNVLVAITGQNGDGIAVIDLTSLPEPLPLPYASAATNNLARMSHGNFAEVMKKSQAQSAKVKGRNRGRDPKWIPHRTKVFHHPTSYPLILRQVREANPGRWPPFEVWGPCPVWPYRSCGNRRSQSTAFPSAAQSSPGALKAAPPGNIGLSCVVQLVAVGPADKAQNRECSATGFLIDKEGYLITNAHVVVDAQRCLEKVHATKILAKLAINDSRTAAAVPCDVVGIDGPNDLAFLKTERPLLANPGDRLP